MIQLFNKDMTRAVTFNRKDFVLSEKDLGKVPTSISTYQGYKQLGLTFIGNSVSARDIVLDGHILGNSREDILDKKRELQSIVSPLTSFWLVVDGTYKIECIADGSIAWAKEGYFTTGQMAKFEISAQALDPFFWKTPETYDFVGYNAGGMHFPFYMNESNKVRFSVRTRYFLHNVHNEGEVPVGMKITIKNTGEEDISGVYIYNQTTDEKMYINYTLRASESIFIDTIYGERSVYHKGAGTPTAIVNIETYLEDGSSFLQLANGDNFIEYGCDEGNASDLKVEVTYTKKYMEAE